MSMYRRSFVINAFGLVSIYDLLQYRRINNFTVHFFTSLLYKTNRFGDVVVRLLSNRSQKIDVNM